MSLGKTYTQVVVSVLLAVLTGLFAQLRFSLGPIPYTMQNTGFIMAGLLLNVKYSFISMCTYVVLIALGLPLASGFRGGLAVLLGYTGGYIVGFILSAMLMSVLSRVYLRIRNKTLESIGLYDVIALLLMSIIATTPTYILGFTVFTYHALGSERLLKWVEDSVKYLGFVGLDKLSAIFLISVAVFIPQDVLMDHVLGVALAKELSKLLKYHGVSIA